MSSIQNRLNSSQQDEMVMTENVEPVERRKHKRHRVKEGVFAIKKASGWQIATVVDINHLGMGIQVATERTSESRYDFFDLFSCDEDPVLKHLPAVIVYHQNNQESKDVHSPELRRCGVKFYGLSRSTQKLLNYFITHHTDNNG